MNDALLVHGFERLGNLMRNHQRVVDRDWPAGDAVGQRLAVDQFQYQRPRPPEFSTPSIVAICGWLSDASTRASRMSRARRLASVANTSGRTFSATSRCRPGVARAVRRQSGRPPHTDRRACPERVPREVAGLQRMRSTARARRSFPWRHPTARRGTRPQSARPECDRRPAAPAVSWRACHSPACRSCSRGLR